MMALAVADLAHDGGGLRALDVAQVGTSAERGTGAGEHDGTGVAEAGEGVAQAGEVLGVEGVAALLGCGGGVGRLAAEGGEAAVDGDGVHRAQAGAGGPNVAVCLEYDALPGTRRCGSRRSRGSG